MFGPASTENGPHRALSLVALAARPVRVIALVLGPLQFSSTIRRYSLQLHRRIGQAYVAAVCIAAIGGLP